MNTPSEEQQCVVDSVKRGVNVMVDACAGSGKSTTIFSCAAACPTMRFVLLTFNKSLQTEVQESIQKLELKNIVVYTYHGLAVKYYSSECHNDLGIRKVLREEMVPQMEIPSFDVMVLDETQDMTKVYYDMIWKFLMDMGESVQLLILGDKKQALYEFKGADPRFLTMADMIWASFPYLKTTEFVEHTLSMSYRITDPMGKFLNKVMLQEERVLTCKTGEPVTYIRRPLYDQNTPATGVLKSMLFHLLRNGAKCDEIFILAKTVRPSANPIIQKLENLLVEEKIPCYVPNTENKDELDTRVIQGKVVFSTFHASKGRQRPYVIVLGFDDTHFMFGDKDPMYCPNELYVACTRATNKLIVWEKMQEKVGPLPFLNYNHTQMSQSEFIKFNGIPSGKRPAPPSLEMPGDEKVKKKYVDATSLIKFISEQTLDVIVPIVDLIEIQVQEPEEPISISSVYETSSGNFEDVSDLNGIVLPLMYCDHLRGEKIPVLQDMIRLYMRSELQNKHNMLINAMRKVPETCQTPGDYLYCANVLHAAQTKLYSRLVQIPTEEYDWLSEDTISSCFANLDEALRAQCEDGNWKSEPYIIRSSDDMAHINIDAALAKAFPESNILYRFTARADIVTSRAIWELKCTSQLTIEHKLQLVLYAWLHQMQDTNRNSTLKYFLFNIKTNEMLQLNASLDQLTAIVVEIIKNKYYKQTQMCDSEFLAQFVSFSSRSSHL